MNYEYEYQDRFGDTRWSVVAPSRAEALRTIEAEFGVVEVGLTYLGCEPVRCVDENRSDCDGDVFYRDALSSSGYRFARCDRHWGARLVEQERIDRDYPDSPIAPSWFDPSYAGESWDEI